MSDECEFCGGRINIHHPHQDCLDDYNRELESLTRALTAHAFVTGLLMTWIEGYGTVPMGRVLLPAPATTAREIMEARR